MIIITHLQKQINVIVPESYTNIMVGLSGGADSAILLYLLAKEIKENELSCNIDTFTVPRPDGGDKYSPKIAEYVADKLQIKVSAPVIIGDGNIDHNIVISEVVKKLVTGKGYNKIYLAENKAQESLCDAVPPTRSPNRFAWKNVTIPFFDLDKSEILELYYIEGVEDLLTLSHSCTTNTVGRCGWCYNCTERAWGFDQLGKVDPGTA